jgi:hypothetical protein
LGIHSAQLSVNPADEIIIGNIPHEQKQAVRHLVEAAVPERVARQRAVVDVAGLSARAGSFVVPAVIEPPIPRKLRARWRSRQRLDNVGPPHAAMLGHVPGRDSVRDPLKAQDFDEPVKQGTGVVVSDGANDPAVAEVGPTIIEVRR